MVLLDRMGQRYGMLPSAILEKATTFDMVAMDISITMEKHWSEKDNPDYIPPVSEEELLRIRDNVK